MKSIDESQSAALFDVFVAAQQGERTTALEVASLGPLAGLLLTGSGWRPDGLALAARALERAVAAWSAESDRRYLSGITTDDVAQAFRSMAGLSCAPLSAPAAAEIIAAHRGRQPSRTRIGDWVEQVANDHPFRRGLEDALRDMEIVDPGPIDALPARPQWGTRFEAWPPSSWWGTVPPTDETAVLLGAARSTLARASLEAGGDELLHVLRSAVRSDLVRRRYDAREHSRAYRYVQWDVAPVWAEDANRPVDGDTKAGRRAAYGGGGLHRGVAASAQMVFHLVATGAPGFEGLLAEQLGIARGLDRLAQLQSEPVRIRPKAVTAATAPSPVVRTTGFLTLDQVGGDPAGLLEQSEAVRRAPAAAKEALIDLYLAERKRFPLEADRRVLFADLAVQLELVRLEDRRRAAELNRTIRAGFMSDAWLAYSVMPYRNVALLDNKAQGRVPVDHRRALAALVTGYEELGSRVAAGIIGDHKMVDEALHQTELGLAGVFLTVTEDHLRSVVHRRTHWGLTDVLASALLWSGRALETLQRLERSDRPPLAEVRYTDGYLSSAAWRAQTRLIQLEAMLAVRTAVLAGLVSSASPAVQRLPASSRDIDDAYRSVIVLPELTAASAPAVVKLGLWLSFLSGGTVPVERDLTPGLKHLGFLCPGPGRIEAEHLVRAELDVREATTWLSDEANYEVRPLQDIPLAGPVSKQLDLRSDGRYGAWRRGEL